ncbi:MAG: hypothetical protein J6D03_02475 [Clostridia bacterium]|nr:hypothetical protein [Clostridia bacterium]
MTRKFINYFLILCTIMLILSGCTKKEENNKSENINNQNPEISRTNIETEINTEENNDTESSTRK